MPKRYLSIWLPYLATDQLMRQQPDLKGRPFVLSAAQKGRMVIQAASPIAVQEGIVTGKVLADARAILPSLEIFDYRPEITAALLVSLAEWCLRFAPIAAVDAPDGIILDISGCPHLWGSEMSYLQTIASRLAHGGYHARLAIADTIGTAWAMARFAGPEPTIVGIGAHTAALAELPPEALRLEEAIVQRMYRLGFRSIGQFMDMPRSTLRRRFGDTFLHRLGQAQGAVEEILQPVKPIEPYQERLPCLEPICTATGIDIALRHLLELLCQRLQKEGKGVRTACFKGYRMDGNMQQISIGTSRASSHMEHLHRLFALKTGSIAPALGIELFTLEAMIVEPVDMAQEALWTTKADAGKIAELLDNIAGKVGMDAIRRYLPAEHHWPERSVTATTSLDKLPESAWLTARPRPLHLLSAPEPIDVMVPLPDYPPILFTHKGRVFKLKKADGPERIEQEWWIADGQSRDYYRVEDEKGARYWLFRLGHYVDGDVQWFLHGFFA